MYRRFWSKVSTGGSGCWEWQGARYTEGYGAFRVDGVSRRAHRVAWFLVHGAWPIGQVLHRCDNPRCVRPSHLFLGSQRDNVADMDAKGRRGRVSRDGFCRTKIATAEVPDVLRAIAAGATSVDIARCYGVTPQAINHFRHRYGSF